MVDTVFSENAFYTALSAHKLMARAAVHAARSTYRRAPSAPSA